MAKLRIFSGSSRRVILGIHLYRKPQHYAFYSFDHIINGTKFKFGSINKEDYHGPDYAEWQYRIKRLCPLQFFIREDLAYWLQSRINIFSYDNWYRRRSREFYWNSIKAKFFTPYNVIKIKTLSHTYCDQREQLLHVNFQILNNYLDEKHQRDESWKEAGADEAPVRVVESEDPLDTYWDNHYKQCIELKEWFQNHQAIHDQWRNELELKYPSKKNKEWAQEYGDLEKKIEQDIDDRLIQLIKLRQGLWT